MADAYLDACCFIYLGGGQRPWRAAVGGLLQELAPEARVITSQLSRLECRTLPVRSGDAALLAQYDRLFAADRVWLIELTAAIVDRATNLRAVYGFKTPDALHLATAIESGAASFWTGDAALARCTDIPVVLVATSR